jgi:hypothetical protein
MINGILNVDTFLVESQSNIVQLDVQEQKIDVEFHSKDARLVSEAAVRYHDESEDVDVEVFFSGSYSWLIDYLISDAPELNRTDEISIRIEENEQSVPVRMTFNRLPSNTNKHLSIMQISGNIDPEYFGLNHDDYYFIEDLNFIIKLTIRFAQH